MMTLTCPTPIQRQAIASAREEGFAVPLPWSALRLDGVDAQKFLQGQVSCDMKRISPEQASLGCLLSLKGRIEASVVIVMVDDGYELLMPQGQLAAVKARLAKYGAFSKVSIRESASSIEGLLGAKAIPNTLPHAPYAALAIDGIYYIRLAGLQRVIKLSSSAASSASAQADDTALAAWHAEAIACGEATIDQALIDQWQPQELDYHGIGGVSYEKGCYMGQEIVARLYFRGQLKTGLCWLRATWPDAVNAALDWPIMTNDKAVGRVISLAWPNADELWLLASVRLEAENLQWVMPDGQIVALTRHDFIRHGAVALNE